MLLNECSSHLLGHSGFFLYIQVGCSSGLGLVVDCLCSSARVFILSLVYVGGAKSLVVNWCIFADWTLRLRNTGNLFVLNTIWCADWKIPSCVALNTMQTVKKKRHVSKYSNHIFFELSRKYSILPCSAKTRYHSWWGIFTKTVQIISEYSHYTAIITLSGGSAAPIEHITVFTVIYSEYIQ